MQRQSIARWILVAGLVFVFGYFGVDKFLNPLDWIGWIPDWIDGMMGTSKNIWLQIIGGSEILFAAMLLIPVRNLQRAASILMALHLLGVLTQVGWNDVAVRDIGILIADIALLFLL